MKILIFPEDKNPYQTLLYNKLEEKLGLEIKYLDRNYMKILNLNIFFLPFRLLKWKKSGYEIFHLHWTYGFASPLQNIIFQTLYFVYFLMILVWIKILGYKIVWTVHNVIPHEKQFVNDLIARRFLARICDAKIVHCKDTIDEMRKYDLNTENISIIPIGNYISVYPNTSTMQESRRKLGISEEKFIFLHFGNIRFYKGIDHLLENFEKLSQLYPHLYLLIAGPCYFKKVRQLLNKYRNYNAIKISCNYIPDNEIQYYFNASDIAIFPFEKVTTSSSVILAISFKITIIAPRLGCLKELPSDIGIFYDPKDEDGLYNAMNKAVEGRDRIHEMGRKGYKFIKELDWEKIAEMTYYIYRNL